MDHPTPRRPLAQTQDALSSSPAFATPVLPIPTRVRPLLREPRAPITTAYNPEEAAAPSPVLPISLPAATLRPIAFRTFTKKHNLTLTSSALQTLATFVGKHCGSRWREEGLAESVLEETAKSWKKADGKVIVDTQDGRLASILKQIESSMTGGKVSASGTGASLSRQSSAAGDMLQRIASGLGRSNSLNQDSAEPDNADLGDDENPDDIEDAVSKGVRSWMQVVSAFEQPALSYNPGRKHFEKSTTTTKGMLPPVSHKTDLMRQRFHLIHQAILRNESFQVSSVGRQQTEQTWRLTSIANLLGRSGTGHLILGLLHVSPTGQLALSDLTGTVILDLSQASAIDEIETWVCPGMVVLVDGIYEEEISSGSLSGTGGIGGTVSGRFVGFSIGAPRCETRAQTLGLSDGQSDVIGGGFGWVDFLGLGSERAVGSRMKRIEQRIYDSAPSDTQDHSPKVIVVGQVTLDDPQTVAALRKLFASYVDTTPPAAFVLFGSFISQPALANLSSRSSAQGVEDTSSVAYKECFDVLAAVLHDFPALLRHSTFVFVPGDNDAWASSFSAGAAVPLPHAPVPSMFTNRVNREFTAANADRRNKSSATEGQAVWTSNPSRLSVFGPLHEIVLFRDDASGRLRRNAISMKKSGQSDDQALHSDSGISMSGDIDSSPPPQLAEQLQLETVEMQDVEAAQDIEATEDAAVQHARRLTKTLLDQAHISPYLLDKRPLHWSYGHALSLYPLPSTFVLCDTEAEAFCLVYQGCCTINPGRLTTPSGAGSIRSKAQWVEYDLVSRRGDIRELLM